MNYLHCIVSMAYLTLLLSQLILSPKYKKTHMSNLQCIYIIGHQPKYVTAKTTPPLILLSLNNQYFFKK